MIEPVYSKESIDMPTAEPRSLDEAKYQKLKTIIREFDSVLVAFSGGIDSTVVAYVCHQVLGNKAIAVTSTSASLKRSDMDLTRELAATWGMEHRLILTDEIKNKNYQKNPNNRCYFCKSTLYRDMQELANELKVSVIANGTSVDDQGDYRPGLIAADEYAVRSPLLEAGYTKQDIRELANYLGLKNANKPASACLASRVPYGKSITNALLNNIEQAESIILSFGIRECRARDHGDVVRIEINPDEFTTLLEHRATIEMQLKSLGYTFVALDIGGFRSGSMNETLKSQNIIAVSA